MTDVGKNIRMQRIMNRETGKIIIVPMDHGVSVGPIHGLINMPGMINKVAEGGANAVLLHKGIIKTGHRECGKDIGLIMHLSGSTSFSPDPNNKVLVATVEEAIKLGADAVSVHINIGAKDEPDMLKILGKTAEQCSEWGMPLLAMMYPRGEKTGSEHNSKAVKLVARCAAELGADIVKTNYTGDIESFKEVVNGCPVPVIIAGGPKMDTPTEMLQMVHDAMKAGAAGTSIGRNIFQNKDPIRIVRAINGIINYGHTVEEILMTL